MKIFFVKENGSTDYSYNSQKAFKIFVKIGQRPLHITEDEASKIVLGENVLFVLEDLSSAFAVELSSKNARIISPLVVLYLKHESGFYNSIPTRSYPLMSQCLRSFVVTSTGFLDKEKESLIKKVRAMSAIYDAHFHSGVTVLVAKNIISEKYWVASRMGIPVVTKDFITQCWFKHQDEIKSGKDVLSKYSIPIFYNLHICISGISLEERMNVEKQVSSNGGRYSGTLSKTTDILISNGVLSPKTRLAESYKIPIVTVQWFEDSLKAKAAKPFEDYRVKKFQHNDRYDMMLSEEATELTQPLNVPINEGNKKLLYAPISVFDAQDNASAIDNIQALCNKLESNGATFLEDLTIFVIGFGPHLTSSIRRACTLAGAVSINSLSGSPPTQIIVGPQICDMEANNKLVEKLKKMNDIIVSIDWLIDSFNSDICCEVKLYNHNPFEPPTKCPTRFPSGKLDKENTKITLKKIKQDDSDDDDDRSPIKKSKPTKVDDYIATTSTLKYLIFSGFDEPQELFSDKISSFEVLKSIPNDKKTAKLTCLVIKELNTSEKVLSAMAAGVYILKESFLDCRHFTEDEAQKHEWAKELKTSKSESTRALTTEQQVLLSTRLSRVFFHKSNSRVFENVSVLLFNHSEELDSISKILEAGGATIFQPTLSNFKSDIHEPAIFGLMDLKNYKKPVNRTERTLINKCVQKYSQENRLFKPRFISHFLCGLEKSSFDFFTHFHKDPSILPDFLQPFLLTFEDFAEFN